MDSFEDKWIYVLLHYRVYFGIERLKRSHEQDEEKMIRNNVQQPKQSHHLIHHSLPIDKKFGTSQVPNDQRNAWQATLTRHIVWLCWKFIMSWWNCNWNFSLHPVWSSQASVAQSFVPSEDEYLKTFQHPLKTAIQFDSQNGCKQYSLWVFRFFRI